MGACYFMHVSKNVNLDEGMEAPKAHRGPGERYSKVIKRKMGPPIRTFGDLEKALDRMDGWVVDLDLIEQLRRIDRKSKRKSGRASASVDALRSGTAGVRSEACDLPAKK